MTFERLGERARVLEPQIHHEMAQIGASVSFDHAEHLRMRKSHGEDQPTLVIEARRINDQRVALPLADRMTHPCRIGLLRMGAPVEKNLPVVRLLLEEQQQKAPRVNELVKKRNGRGWITRHAET